MHSSIDLKQTVTDSSSFEKWYSPLLVTNRRKITLKSGEAFTPLISSLGRYLAQMQPLLSVNRVLPPFSNSCDLSQSSCCVPVQLSSQGNGHISTIFSRYGKFPSCSTMFPNIAKWREERSNLLKHVSSVSTYVDGGIR